MKRRLQIHLERKYGSAYRTVEPAVQPASAASDAKGSTSARKIKKGRAAKQRVKPQPPPDGGRFDLRYRAMYDRELTVRLYRNTSTE